MGAMAAIWFLVRVIPKPIRATYPCQQAAFPLASALVIWLLGLKAAHLSSLRALQLRRWVVIVGLGFALSAAARAIFTKARPLGLVRTNSQEAPNQPIGVAQGIFPGRVAWIRDVQATPWDGVTGHWWDDPAGTDQAAVDRMAARALRTLSGATTDEAAWENIFRFYNRQHGRGDTGYQVPETIVVKINCNNAYAGYEDSDHQIDASPRTLLAILDQLIRRAGVPPQCITVYEAARVIPDRIYRPCHAQYPEVLWADTQGDGSNGRQPITWRPAAFAYSTNNANCGNSLPTCVYDATYLVNLALLKGHMLAGISLTAKNHYGSIDQRDHSNYANAWAHAMGVYHPFVDLMGTRRLGGKTILWMIDGLYGVRSVSDIVENQYARWHTLFAGRWSASLFMSLDPVAIDSVGFDFLWSEFGETLGNGAFANADNYLHEAALADQPPSGTVYQPDGVPLPSLGVHEHWNNPLDKQYSRNLGTGDGIELVAVHSANGLDVVITNPADGMRFTGPTRLPVQARAEAAYSSIRQLQFYGGGRLLGTSPEGQFSLVWSNPPPGNWDLYAVATDTDNFSATSAVVTITVESAVPAPPAILTQPTNQAAWLGTTATFHADASGWPPPAYQWYREGIGLLGANAATLLLPEVTLEEAGDYYLVASNALSRATSQHARLAVLLPPAQHTFISTGAHWKYFDRGEDLGTRWRLPDYDDAAWSTGVAELGYGDDIDGRPETTVISFGPNPSDKFNTTYFRHAFVVEDLRGLLQLEARLLRDDGGVVYLNGTEVFRSNMPSTPVEFATRADRTAVDDGANFFPAYVPLDLLRPGTNLLAVEVHQDLPNTPDLSFDFELIGSRALQLPQILAQPLDQFVLAGDAAWFSVEAVSAAPLTYHWWFNDSPLDSSNGPTLRLPSIAPGHDAGLYSVVVSNAFGALTSAPAALIIVTQLNQAPVLAPFPDQDVDEGTPLLFYVNASDPDSPPQTLHYSLADPPTGASIEPATGRFSWAPSELQGPGTNAVTICVADDGTPLRSASGVVLITIREVNEPPVLQPILDQVVTPGAQLSFTAMATDPDLPAQTLTFSLDPGAPDGAHIDSMTGVFTWRPPVSIAPGTNLITVRVSDDGIPPKTDARTFQARVTQPLQITSITFDGDAATVSWRTVPGCQYQVRWTARLDGHTWLDLGEVLTAGGQWLSITDQTGGSTQRFYRILLLE